jgi:AraC-like DNA-binding protein
MDMGPQVDVETGPSLMLCHDGRIGSAPIGTVVASSTVSAEQFTFEAGKLIDDIRLALSSDLSVATKKAASLSLLLATKVARHERPALARGGLAAWQKEKIKNYIKDRLDRPVPIEDLARLATLSTSYFCRAFKDSFGEPPHAYVMRMRIAHAQALMMSTSENLSQIALACGLVDQSHLCRCFRQITGATPGAWRRSNAPGPSSRSAEPRRPDDLPATRAYSQRSAPSWLQS